MSEFYFERPVDTDVIVLFKAGLSREIGIFSEVEALRLWRSLDKAIDELIQFKDDNL